MARAPVPCRAVARACALEPHANITLAQRLEPAPQRAMGNAARMFVTRGQHMSKSPAVAVICGLGVVAFSTGCKGDDDGPPANGMAGSTGGTTDPTAGAGGAGARGCAGAKPAAARVARRRNERRRRRGGYGGGGPVGDGGGGGGGDPARRHRATTAELNAPRLRPEQPYHNPSRQDHGRVQRVSRFADSSRPKSKVWSRAES